MKNSCPQCGKNVSIYGLSCKCGNIYCLKCLNPHLHNCTFDHKKDNQKKLEEKNQKVSSNRGLINYI